MNTEKVTTTDLQRWGFNSIVEYIETIVADYNQGALDIVKELLEGLSIDQVKHFYEMLSDTNEWLYNGKEMQEARNEISVA